MVSFALKSLEKQNIDNLEKYISNLEILDVYYTQKKFKFHYVLIIHYVGTNETLFLNHFSNAISEYIIDSCEKKFIESQIKYDYFYFNKLERDKITNSTLIALNQSHNIEKKLSAIQESLNKFHTHIHKYNLDGFINFRLSNYKSFLSYILEQEIHNFVVEKEYIEYIALLKEYIAYQTPQNDTIHLFYTDANKFLLDENGKIITTTSSKKYLSDISFSSNDFILNSILSLMPQKLIIHQRCDSDSFVNFLKTIFQERCEVCTNCSLCSQKFSNDDASMLITIKQTNNYE